MTAPHIEIRRDGAVFRVAIDPAEALPKGWHRPETFSSLPLARMGAKIMAEATGLPIVDMVKTG